MTAEQPRDPKTRMSMALVMTAAVAVLALIAIVLTTGLQMAQNAANPSVAAANQATNARTEAKTMEGEARADRVTGQ